ncbi:MAG TPA: transglycosylase family protein [Acidimicrobiales bacterium]|nr:transglycosylase family protein [Acidimicrobiales bacterium]
MSARAGGEAPRPDERRARPRAGRAVAAALGLLGGLAAPARAGTPASLRARAQAIAASIAADEASARALGERYVAAAAARARAEAAAAASRRAIAALDASIATSLAAIRRAAVAAYVNAGASSELAADLVGSPNELPSRLAYLHAAAGELETQVSLLADERRRRAVRLAEEQRAVDEAAAAARAAATARAAVVARVARARATLASVRGRLAALVAAAAAARARAAAAAAARAASAGPPALDPSPAPSAPAEANASPIPAALAGDFAGIRSCESGGRYDLDTGNGYYGAYQFSLPTWEGLGESGLPSAAPPATQDAAALALYDRSGWAAWPECAAILGL